MSESINGNVPQAARKTFKRQDWAEKFRRCGAKCHYCSKPLTFAEASKDHLTPLCRGGADELYNIVPACLDCNLMKAWRTELEFVRDREMLMKKRHTGLRALDKPKPYVISVEEEFEPGLLKTLVNEREGRARWWKA